MTGPRAVVVMGPAGSGKTTIGELLAEAAGWRFIEGDAFHPRANRDKMAAGVPLDDADRAPWLDAVAAEIEKARATRENVVVACSALKESYRARLRVHPDVAFVLLDVPEDILFERLKKRKGHFMPTSLLKSQIETLQRPAGALVADASKSPSEIVAQIRGALGF